MLTDSIESKKLDGKIEPIKIFKCNEPKCTKSYKSKENLTLHIKNFHLNEKPYSCKYCDSTFSHRNGKTYHERKFHTNYLPYKCTINGKIIIKKILECELTFADKTALNYHLKSKHNIIPPKRLQSQRSKFSKKIFTLISG
jgi:hypothetical protein